MQNSLRENSCFRAASFIGKMNWNPKIVQFMTNWHGEMLQDSNVSMDELFQYKMQ